LRSFVSLIGIGVFQYLQSVTRRISLGAEFMYQQAPTIPGGVGAAVLSVGGRYTGDESVWSGYAGTATFGMCYYRRLTDFAHIGLEVDNNYAQGATNVAFGCQYDHQRANFIFKGNYIIIGDLCFRMKCIFLKLTC